MFDNLGPGSCISRLMGEPESAEVQTALCRAGVVSEGVHTFNCGDMAQDLLVSVDCRCGGLSSFCPLPVFVSVCLSPGLLSPLCAVSPSILVCPAVLSVIVSAALVSASLWTLSGSAPVSAVFL